ncbi:choice-of-anchor I family protein [Paenibacillus sp. PL91]|uniref:choice-of-anchor I family protein n=1 Tax=Paenibacillus sp. PL91 TaxID=2729538 RepID=UPI001CB9D176|nr:choice-of-anchor I family protein [Paenibacillus sp. PL91]
MRIYSKRLFSLLLAAEITASMMLSAGPVMAADLPLSGTPYTVDNTYDVTVPHVIINQVYGGGLTTDPSILLSHGFIELYNPTNNDIDLSGWSLQYADRGSNAKTGPTLPWEKLDLTGTIKAHSSFLIKGASTGATSPKVNLSANGDQSWERPVNNKGLKVALMSNQTLLTDVNPFVTKPVGYVDMVGTGSNDDGSDIDGFETAYPSGSAEGTSKKKAIRRSNFTDTDMNKSDFKQVDYEVATGDALLAAAPRSGSDGAWGPGEVQPLTITTESLPAGYIDSAYNIAFEASGGTAPYSFTASGLPDGLSLASNGVLTGTPTTAVSGAAVTITVTDSTAGTPVKADKSFNLTIQAAENDTLNISKIGEYSIGLSNKDGGVAEIVKFNKDNGKFYLVNGSGNPPSLDIVSLGSGSGTLSKEKTVLVKPLAETEGFVYGDLTSVDINTTTKHVSVSVQEADAMKPGKILVLDYDGNLVASYAAGVQPDMIKSTPDGKYILTADEAEPRSGAADPKGSVTIVNTADKTVKQVLFDDPSVIEDGVHIRGQADPVDGKIKSSGTKADAVLDLEPEYISLSEDNKTAYVSLQENNAIAVIDIATSKVTAVKALGLKDYNAARNALDLQKDGAIKQENVPFKGMYMPDGIATHTINGQTYLFTANEGDVTEWPNRTNGSTIGALKGKLDPNSEAAKFLDGKTAYDGIEVASDMGNDSIYMYGGRSFSIWNASSMQQVYDSGNEFEKITAARLPAYFNTSNSKTALDDRSGKKGPEPEDIKTGKVGNKVFAFVGLERIGGFMTYDVTDPAHATFANYTNTRVFKDDQGKDNLNTDTGPEGLEFIPANISPTGKPLLLVAYEVGGKVGVYQLDVTKVTMDKSSLSLKVGDAASKLNATAEPAGGSAATIFWSSSNNKVATVDDNGNVKAVAEGTAVITALSADGYGSAETVVTVAAAGNGEEGGSSTPTPTPSPTPKPTPETPGTSVNGDTGKAVTVLTPVTDSGGKTTATVTSSQLAATLAALDKAANGKPGTIEFKVAPNNLESATILFEKETIAQLQSTVFSLWT